MLKLLTRDNMLKFRESFLKNKFDLKMLVCGNFVKQEAKNIFKNVKKILENQLTEDSYEEFPDSQLILEPKTQVLYYHPVLNSENRGVSVYFQCPLIKDSKDNIVLLQLYKRMFSSFFHGSLRNNQQLAYDLGIHLETKRNFTGIYFYLATEKYTADEVEKCILEFIQKTYQSIQNDASVKSSKG